MEKLTRSQLRVSALVAQGQSNKQIARTLQIAESTVKAHVLNTLNALELGNRVQLAVWYATVTRNCAA